MTPEETKQNTEMDIQMKQILVLAHEDLNHHQDAKENKEKVEKNRKQVDILLKSQNLFFKKN